MSAANIHRDTRLLQALSKSLLQSGPQSEASWIYWRHLFSSAGIPPHQAQQSSLSSLPSSLSPYLLLHTDPHLVIPLLVSSRAPSSLMLQDRRELCAISPAEGGLKILPSTWFQCEQGRRTGSSQPPSRKPESHCRVSLPKQPAPLLRFSGQNGRCPLTVSRSPAPYAASPTHSQAVAKPFLFGDDGPSTHTASAQMSMTSQFEPQAWVS